MAHLELLIQAPAKAAQLIVLLHGKNGSPGDMQALGQALAESFPQARVLAPQAPLAAQAPGHGHLWFEVEAEEERFSPRHIDSAMIGLGERMVMWQSQAEISRAETALIGFGQGATLALQSTLLATPWADRVMALAGAFAQKPVGLHYLGSVHLLHGKNDALTHWKTVLEDAYCLRDSGIDMTAEILPLIGHEMHPTMIKKATERLSTHISKHLFEAAMTQAPGNDKPALQ